MDQRGWLFHFLLGARYGLFTGTQDGGPMEGAFGFGLVRDVIYQDREILNYIVLYGDDIHNTRAMLRRQEKQYVDSYSAVLDAHFLVPFSHVRRAALIKRAKHQEKELQDANSRQQRDEQQPPQEVEVRLRRAPDINNHPHYEIV